jgi:hypothetical protein
MHCQPMLEDQFKPVIAENYYKPRLFWFELDRDQTKKLISLFSSSPVIADTSLPSNSSLFKASSVQEGDSIEMPTLEWDAHPGQATAEWESRHGHDLWGGEALIDEEVAEKDEETGDHDRSYASVVRDVRTSFTQKKWSDLLKDSNSYTARRKVEDFKTPALEQNLPSSHQSNIKRESAGVAPCMYGGCDLSDAAADDLGIYNDQLVSLGPNSEVLYSSSFLFFLLKGYCTLLLQQKPVILFLRALHMKLYLLLIKDGKVKVLRQQLCILIWMSPICNGTLHVLHPLLT